MQKQKITTIITLLLIILLGGYIYKDTFSKNINEENIATSTPEIVNKTEGDVQIGFEYVNDDGLIIKAEPIKAPAPAIDIPNLDREIVFSDDFVDNQKEKTTQKIKDIVSRLKSDNTLFDNWISLGANRKMIGDYEGAVEAWEYASKIAPLHIVPLNNLGNLYHYQLRDYPKAEEYFRKAINVGSNYTSPYINLFELYSLSYKQETNSAENILLEGLENKPNEITLLMTLATYYKDNGDNKNAITYYEKTAQQAKVIGNTDLYNQIQTQISELK